LTTAFLPAPYTSSMCRSSQFATLKRCAVAHPENIASQAVMKRLGMEYIQNAVFYGAEVVYFATQKG